MFLIWQFFLKPLKMIECFKKSFGYKLRYNYNLSEKNDTCLGISY